MSYYIKRKSDGYLLGNIEHGVWFSTAEDALIFNDASELNSVLKGVNHDCVVITTEGEEVAVLNIKRSFSGMIAEDLNGDYLDLRNDYAIEGFMNQCSDTDIEGVYTIPCDVWSNYISGLKND